jgi:glycolate oxidase iron-sulfur subunit
MKEKSLPVSVDPETYDKFNACVHCGLCLPACPTYVETSNEAESPRGRIHLMKAAVDGVIAPSQVVLAHLDQCLVCRACETACPSGVVYHDLIEAVRPQVAQAVNGRPMASPLLEWIIKHIFPFSGRVRAAIFPLRLARKIGMGSLVDKISSLLPAPLPGLTAMLPPGPVIQESLPPFTAAQAPRRGSVVLLMGCVGAVLSDHVNRAAIAVLSRNGFDVHLLEAEPCCGAMAAHANDPASAEKFARGLIDMLAKRPEDYFVSPIAGCGAQLKMLDHVLPGHPRAAAVVKKMRDITELLHAVGLRPPAGRIDRTITYHDPCHLIHGQRISSPPRQLLGLIPGLKIVPLRETDLCCGAAGTYNLSQPAMANTLGQRKAANILATGAVTCVTANIGCQLQIQKSLAAAGSTIPVLHVVELLEESYKNAQPASGRK